MFARPVWGCALSWLVWTALSGQCGLVFSMLGQHFWTPLARLTYCIYLFHITAIEVPMGNADVAPDFTPFSGAQILAANVFFGAAGAMVLFLLVRTENAPLPTEIPSRSLCVDSRSKSLLLIRK